MNIKTGDKVIVLSGDDKGKVGVVQKVYVGELQLCVL